MARTMVVAGRRTHLRMGSPLPNVGRSDGHVYQLTAAGTIENVDKPMIDSRFSTPQACDLWAPDEAARGSAATVHPCRADSCRGAPTPNVITTSATHGSTALSANGQVYDPQRSNR